MNKPFILKAPYKPAGDQPKAIKNLISGLNKNYQRQTLLGVTGSGKTFTLANIINETQKPALVISHNKTLAGQLYEEFSEYFPQNAVHYFVSYYDYYQPEAYIPTTDTYITKDAGINDEIDRLRHAAMEAVLTRPDCIVIASVSCIYGVGNPKEYFNQRLSLTKNSQISRRELLKHLTSLQYIRNDADPVRGSYQVRGDTIDIRPAGEDHTVRVELSGPKIENLFFLDALTREIIARPSKAEIFAATFYLAAKEQQEIAIASIRQELQKRLNSLKKQNKLLEAQRLEQRTNYDLEMIEQIGYVSGIENYSRHFDNRSPGQPPSTLIDYFVHAFSPQGFLTLIDESHMTIPQLAGMYAGDRARKDTLVNFGFRLPSARDNRPLKFHEFKSLIGPTIFVSATPAQYEQNTSEKTIEQVVRPTGLLDPATEVRPSDHQVDDVINEIKKRTLKKQRVLVTTLSKRLAEDLANYLVELDIKAAYIHSDINTIDRLKIIKDLRRGSYNVLVGINLLREGLDMPEVSLVAILDADQEGFLRSTTSLVQTMGRAARHIDGRIIMYANKITGSMKEAIEETNRRRIIQKRYNQKHNIAPRSIKKNISTLNLAGQAVDQSEEDFPDTADIPPDEINRAIKTLTNKMELAAKNLDFEKATRLRDTISKLKYK